MNKIEGLRSILWIMLCGFVLSAQSMASSLSFSGRLVNADGSPVAGPVDLRFDLAYSGTKDDIECYRELSDVALSSGVFHVNLDFLPANCLNNRELAQVLQDTPDTESLMMRVSDQSDSANIKTYPFQALNSVPMSVMSEVSKTLVQMGAANGEVLKWNGTEWAPASDDGEPGTVTDIEAGNGLTANGVSGGTITGSGIIAVAPGGIDVGMLADNAVTTDKIVDETIQNVDIANGVITYAKLNIGDGQIPVAKVSGLGSAAYANIGMENGNVLGASELPACSAAQKLRKILSPVPGWTCEDDSTGTDDSKLPLAGGTMDGTINMNGNALTNVQTPLVDTDAATKKYVDDGLANKADSTQLGDYVAKAGDSMTGALQLDAQNELRLADSDSTNYVALRSNATVGTNFILTLPSSAGTADQVLTTDGTGVLTWSTPSSSATPEGSAGGELAGTYPNPTIANAVIDDANVMTGANISAAKVGTGIVDNTEFDALDGVSSSIQSQLDGKESTVATGTTSQYWRGDKSWQTLDTLAVPENTNLYFTNARAQGAVVTQTIGDGVTITSPSEDAVFDALALKADASQLSSYVLKAGDTMSGVLDMGANAIENLQAPLLDTDAATKKYVDDGLALKADSTSLSSYVAKSGDSMSGALQLNAQSELRLADGDSSNYVSLKSPMTVSANLNFILPAADGSAGQILSTDGAGNLAWASSGDGSVTGVTASAPLSSTDGVTPDISIAQSSSTADGFLSSTDWNTFNNKEPAVTAATTSDYRRGDKTWQTLDTSVVPENTNLYFTDARAKSATVDDSIVDAVVDRAPSQNAVNDALALKADSSSLSSYVLKAGDTMTGALNLPTDGLAVGSTQLVSSGGNIGIGTGTPSELLVIGDDVGNLTASSNTLVVGDSNDPARLYMTEDSNNFASMFWDNTNDLLAFDTKEAGTYHAASLVLKSKNVGVGTSAPSQRLHISGGAADGSLFVDGYSSTVGASAATIKQSSGNRSVMLIEHSSTTGGGGGLTINTNGTTGNILDVKDEGASKLTVVDGGNVGIGTPSPSAKLDVEGGEIHSNNRYSRTVTFTDGWAVGDYAEIVQASPAAAGAASLWEVNISGSRNSWTESNTYRIAGTHSADSIWREAGQVSDNTYVGNSKCFTLDYKGNGNSPQFRIRAVKASTSCGVAGNDLNLKTIIYSKSDNTGWSNLSAVGTGATVTGFQSMGQSWNLYTGNPEDSNAKVALHADVNANVGVGKTNPKAKLDVNGATISGNTAGSTRGAVTKGVVNYFTTDNNTTDYIHLRMPFNVTTESDMYHIKVTGYAYGASKVVDLTYVGYVYEATSSLQNTQALDPTGSFSPTQYIGSDNNLYLRFKPPSIYYLSFRVDSMYVGNGRVIEPGEITVIRTSATTL